MIAKDFYKFYNLVLKYIKYREIGYDCKNDLKIINIDFDNRFINISLKDCPNYDLMVSFSRNLCYDTGAIYFELSKESNNHKSFNICYSLDDINYTFTYELDRLDEIVLNVLLKYSIDDLNNCINSIETKVLRYEKN